MGQPCRDHDLRHTHASWLIAAGEHPKTIQTRLGHSSIQVTMDRYEHLLEGLDDCTADRLEQGKEVAVPTGFEPAFPA